MLRITVETRKSSIVGHDESLSVFLRLLLPLRKLHEEKWAAVTEVSTETLQRDSFPPTDVLILNRPTSDESIKIVACAKRQNIPVIVDMDDWMYSTPSYGNCSLRVVDPDLLRTIYNNASVMTFPTSFFSQIMRPLFSGPHVIVPFGIELNTGKSPDVNSQSRKILISSMFALKINARIDEFSSALKQFLDSNSDWSIDFYCENFDRATFTHPRIRVLDPMPYKDYIDLLDSGIYSFCLAPLSGFEDDADLVFNACKSPVKYVDYSSRKIPCLYSRSPVYLSIIDQNVTGILVENTREDWLSGMTRMATDAELRERIAKAAYADICRRFTLTNVSEAWKKAIQQAVRQ